MMLVFVVHKQIRLLVTFLCWKLVWFLLVSWKSTLKDESLRSDPAWRTLLDTRFEVLGILSNIDSRDITLTSGELANKGSSKSLWCSGSLLENWPTAQKKASHASCSWFAN